ncbi:MAG TPA: NAD(+) diphosphatase [Steroidobacteraceae bacterium]|nr:NAD(+) diphosphatase [Steroidobacteraceae bacterium]
MERDRPNFFAGPYIDRRAEQRDNPQWLEEARADPATRYLIARGTAQLVRGGAEPHVALLADDSPLLGSIEPGSEILLGWFQGTRCVLAELVAPDAAELPPATELAELRPLAAVLPADEAGLLAYARALLIWRARQRHCGVCGAATVPTRAGHCLVCTRASCAQEYFPRIDPAIIVLVSDGERALLGRQASWPARRYSTIAGFVEPGESLEDAVVREVAEETGVAVQEVRYHSSQPWPFPSSVMLGFQARSEPGSEVRVGGELEDARWFTRAQVHAGDALTPPSHSISWRLIETWLKDER